MLSIRLKPALERRLSRLARQTGRTKTFYATKLIEENIEDLEDRYLAEARLENRGKRYSTAQVRRLSLGFAFSFFHLVAQPLLLALSFEGAVHNSPLGSLIV